MATAEGAYYERYWSAVGSGYVGGTDPALQTLFPELVSATTRCLDVGCGDGLAAGRYLSEHAGSYVGVDVSQTAVGKARENGLDARVIDDAAALPFPGDSFDLVLCIEVLEHLFEPAQAVREIARVLRPGGQALFQVPNVAHWRHRVDLGLRGRFNPLGDRLSVEEPWRDPHIRFFTPSTLPRMLEALGLRAMTVQGTGTNQLLDVPVMRRFVRSTSAGPVAAYLFSRWPGVFANRVVVVAVAPE